MRSLESLVLVAALACTALVTGCQSIAGIEERRFVGGDAGGGNGNDAGTPLASKKDCEDFCADVFAQCTDDLQSYVTEDACIAVCQHWAVGNLEDKDPKGNNFACRLHQIDLAKKLGGDDTATYCRASSAGGAGRCGSDCEGYCELFDQVCAAPLDGEFPLPNRCPEACGGLPNDGKFSVEDRDTLQCRMYHLTNSAVGDPRTHCGHAQLAHPTSHCFEKNDAKPECSVYCATVMALCSDEFAVYESQAQCEAVCATLDPGTYGDQTISAMPPQNADTIGCRLWHAYSASIAPKDHCPHASATGDGHCGIGEAPNCPPYCKLLESACPAKFAEEFDDDDDGCREECAKLDSSKLNSGFTVETALEAKGDLQCRYLFAARAAEKGKNAAACESAIGRGECK